MAPPERQLKVRTPGALVHLKSALRAGFPVMEIERAPPLRELLRDPKWAEIAPAQSANR